MAHALTTLIDSGSPSNRVDIAILGDGYTVADHDAGVFTSQVNDYLDYLFGASALVDPFPRYRNFFNAHAIEVYSNESGADQPPNGIYRDTALDATYFAFGVERRLTVNETKANAARNAALSGTGIAADMQYVVVNDTKYGGSGGKYAVFAGGNSSAHEIGLHEVAHSFSNLADEYVSYSGAYTGSEPIEVNATKDPDGGKWSHWLGYDDPRGSYLDIGVYQGGKYYPTGLYRPSPDSKMRTLNRAFDAVSREKIIQDIYRFVDPIDDHRVNRASLVNPEDLWVDVVDPDVIKVEWYIDGVLSEYNSGEFFDPSLESFTPGIYDVTARAYDEVLDYAFTGGPLDLVRSGLAALEQSVSWNLIIIPDGDYDINGVVDPSDYVVWKYAYGSTAQLNADGNGDGVVDAADYTVWRDAYQDAAARSPGVPEPASAALVIVALLALSGRHRG